MGWKEGRGSQPWTGLSCTEEEKAEAREFEEDQVAGRLKEDVVSVEGSGEYGGQRRVWGETGPPPSSSFLFLLFAARAERQVTEVGGKGGEWAGHLGIRLERVSALTWVDKQMA